MDQTKVVWSFTGGSTIVPDRFSLDVNERGEKIIVDYIPVPWSGTRVDVPVTVLTFNQINMGVDPKDILSKMNYKNRMTTYQRI